jgi:hypothetical protein
MIDLYLFKAMIAPPGEAVRLLNDLSFWSRLLCEPDHS